ncbi:MAG TPA: GntR family transcriptional regulator [Thermomicrobiales bacterium]|nr:GntR family transcriptional regulator [Thermomicrobiales bacterium]
MDWGANKLNRHSPVPLYYQLVEHIRKSVRIGQLGTNAKLPAERDIAEQAGVSRMTVRQALTFLEREGVLVARPGVGTFVAAPKLTYDALHLVGFAEETMRHGGAVASSVIELGIGAPPAPIQVALRLSRGETAVKIVRLRAAGDDPLLLETSYLPADRCAGIEQEDLESQSLYTLLETRYGLRLMRATQTIEASAASEFEANLFGVADGAPVLVVEGVAYTVDDQPVECFRAVYRADRVSLGMESHRTERATESGISQVSVVVAP